jgi:hypothetical protein
VRGGCRWPEGSEEGGRCWQALSTGNQISSRLLSAKSANALLEIPRVSVVATVSQSDPLAQCSAH